MKSVKYCYEIEKSPALKSILCIELSIVLSTVECSVEPVEYSLELSIV